MELPVREREKCCICRLLTAHVEEGQAAKVEGKRSARPWTEGKRIRSDRNGLDGRTGGGQVGWGPWQCGVRQLDGVGVAGGCGGVAYGPAAVRPAGGGRWLVPGRGCRAGSLGLEASERERGWIFVYTHIHTNPLRTIGRRRTKDGPAKLFNCVCVTVRQTNTTRTMTIQSV